MKELILKLFEIGALKFGQFKLKSGMISPVYVDLRVIISYPKLLAEVSELLWAASSKAEYSTVCGVPYTALPMATCISVSHSIPMLIRRKEAKDYGTKKMVEGYYEENSKCLIVEDVVTTGSSVLETAELLRKHKIVTSDAVVLLDRQQGGKEKLAEKGISLRSVLTLVEVVENLCEMNKIEKTVVDEVKQFVASNNKSLEKNESEKSGFPFKQKETAASSRIYGGVRCDRGGYRKRAVLSKHLVTRKLFEIMESKQTNLCLSADVVSSADLLDLADTLGPLVCAVKTHIDILDDFSPKVVDQLVEIANKHNFLIFEDRKFADIGNTVKSQYAGGAYKISDWSDITNAHSLPGSGIIEGLKAASGGRKDRACLLIAEMSTKNNLANDVYKEATVKMAEEHGDFVIGFICTSKVSKNPQHVHFTPGVKLKPGKDAMGQQYLTPDEVIKNRGCDVIIVGRGITDSANRLQEATAFRNAGWAAYVQRVSS
ncbi:unnamed protein product [Clavelina lepadiformis]|uniref:Uridine 5'-monophosphate synthase n=1 Tax=Clavelina lepadiformis TaxID=159417 RepID=A0ABP0F9Q6_CLALP